MKSKRINRQYLFINLLVFSLLFYSCNKESANSPFEPSAYVRGEIISVTPLGSYSAPVLQAYLNSLFVNSNIKLQFDVEVHKVIYSTLDPRGNLINVSGAVFIPKGKDNLSLMSLHHGTQTKRANVVSVNPMNSPEGFISASLGYYTLVPDYIGLGESKILHPYHHAKSSADAVIDLIRAGKELARRSSIVLNGQVFLAGYSEGGYVTLAAHREIELNYQNEITVTASSPMSGAYDLNFTASTILQNKFYTQPSYLAFFMVAYNDVYGWDKINEIFNSPYAQRIVSLYDGTKTTSEINASLTNDLSQLFKKEYITAYLEGRETALITAFQSNSLLDWTPVAPIRFYHGNADEYVPYGNSVRARDYFRSYGANNTELVTIIGGTHLSAGLPSMLSAIEWFDTIKLKKQMFVFNR